MRNPLTEPCITCIHLEDYGELGYYCKSLKTEVEQWWTGCIRHEEISIGVKQTQPKIEE